MNMKKSQSWSKLWFVLIFVIVAIVGLFAYFLQMSKRSDGDNSNEQTSEQEAENAYIKEFTKEYKDQKFHSDDSYFLEFKSIREALRYCVLEEPCSGIVLPKEVKEGTLQKYEFLTYKRLSSTSEVGITSFRKIKPTKDVSAGFTKVLDHTWETKGEGAYTYYHPLTDEAMFACLQDKNCLGFTQEDPQDRTKIVFHNLDTSNIQNTEKLRATGKKYLKGAISYLKNPREYGVIE